SPDTNRPTDWNNMHSLMFAYVKARQLDIALEVQRRHLTDSASIRDRLGKALIAWGEQLVTLPPGSKNGVVRSSVYLINQGAK
ncbi:MAG: hypothetical protein ACXWH0_14160, partial [Acidimicrobiia bacterium]